MENIEIIINFNGQEYKFDSGVKAYIFHTGLYNDMHTLYGLDTLLDYVSVVYSCYISDCNRTNVGALGDYIAEHWKRLENKPPRKILADYYFDED